MFANFLDNLYARKRATVSELFFLKNWFVFLRITNNQKIERHEKDFILACCMLHL